MAVIEIARMKNESQFDYHKRLVYGKLVDKTLSDMDYTELAELVYGQQYSSDVARRMLYGSRRTLELMDKLSVDVEPSEDHIRARLLELDNKILEMKKERQRCLDQRRELNKVIAQDGRREYLEECLIRAAEELPETIGCLYSHGEVFEPKFFSNNEAVLYLSDWHYGMVTNNIFNTYDTEICKRRVKSIVDKTKERIIINECKRLHVVVLGDLCHGAIHTNARVASEELVCDQLMQVSEILAQSIVELSRYVGETIVYTTYGNHARTVQNKHDSTHRDNMERLIPWWLKVRIKVEEAAVGGLNIRVEDESDDEFLSFSVCGHDFCSAHGDLDDLQSSLKTFTTLFMKKRGKNIEYIVLGDKHHQELKEAIGVTSEFCGSLCGTDDHANTKRLYSTPSQLLLIVNESEGVDGKYVLKCD